MPAMRPLPIAGTTAGTSFCVMNRQGTGKERTQTEYVDLLDRVGWKLHRNALTDRSDDGNHRGERGDLILRTRPNRKMCLISENSSTLPLFHTDPTATV